MFGAFQPRRDAVNGQRTQGFVRFESKPGRNYRDPVLLACEKERLLRPVANCGGAQPWFEAGAGLRIRKPSSLRIRLLDKCEYILPRDVAFHSVRWGKNVSAFAA